MNSTLNLLFLKNSKRSWVSNFLIVLSVFLCFTSVIVTTAADIYSTIYFDSTYQNKDINHTNLISYDTSFNGVDFIIENTDPAVFSVGRHYTFDIVFGVMFSNDNLYGDTYRTAINDLLENGYTEEWFAHYVYGFDIGVFDINGIYFNLSPEEYYVPQSETVVYYYGEFFSEKTDVLDDFVPIIDTINGQLYLQVKMHFDFDCTFPIDSFRAGWNTYPFTTRSDENASCLVEVAFDASNLISYDYTAIIGMEMIAVDIKDQISGLESSLTSSLQQLMDQQGRYFELLLGGYEGSNYDLGFGILYEILDLQNQTYTYITRISSNVNSIKTHTSTISTVSATMLQLLNGSNKSFWNFLSENTDILHDDLVDIKNYLDQADKSSNLGNDVGDSIDNMMNVSGSSDVNIQDVELPDFADESGWLWFSQAVDLLDFCLPFLAIVLGFGVLKAVLS